MMEGTGILLIAMAIALMLISPVHLTVTRLRSALIEQPHGGPGGGAAPLPRPHGLVRHTPLPSSPAPIVSGPAFPDQR